MALSIPHFPVGWLGPYINDHLCQRCYRDYLQYRSVYRSRAAVYASTFRFGPHTTDFYFATAACVYLDVKIPDDIWDYPIVPKEQAAYGAWWDVSDGFPASPYEDPVEQTCWYVISAAICAATYQMLVAEMVADAYNIGTGGPGGLLGTKGGE